MASGGTTHHRRGQGAPRARPKGKAMGRVGARMPRTAFRSPADVPRDACYNGGRADACVPELWSILTNDLGPRDVARRYLREGRAPLAPTASRTLADC